MSLLSFTTGVRKLRPRPTGLALVVILLSFALLKLFSLNFVLGDEHMYFYMSLLVSKGKWPYRDFFFSHPPLQLYIMGAVYKLFGYSLEMSKAIPSIAAMVSAVHVWLIGRRLVGRTEGVVAAFLFLFTYDVLRGSSHFTGANCALSFGLAAAYQALAGRQIVAAMLFAMGTFTGIYIAPLALMSGALLVFRSWKESLRLLGTFALACVLTCVIFAGVASWQPFWYQIVGYNLNKITFRYSWFAKFRNVAYLNTLVMLGFVPGIVWAACMWKVRGRSRGDVTLPGIAGRIGAWLNLWNGDRVAAQMLFATLTCGHLYFYSTLANYYSYYFMLVMPWMALMTATFTVDVVRYLRERKHPAGPVEGPVLRAEKRRREKAARPARAGQATQNSSWTASPLIIAGVALVAVLFYRQSIGNDRQAEMGDEGSHYTWHDSRYLPRWMNSLVQWMVWSPSSDPIHPPNAVTYYLQHESLHAVTVNKFIQAVRTECHPGERIFGEYSLGPFAAALGPCVLAANLVDTVPQRLKVHESTPEGWVAALEADHLDIAIVVPGSSMLKEPVLRDYFAKTFPRTVAVWDDAHAGHVELRRRK